MASREISHVVLIGAGNLASHLGSALVRAGMKVVQVVNRSPVRGMKLAKKLGADFTADLTMVESQADLYIVAISDMAVYQVAAKLRLPGRLVVHTSGSVDRITLEPISVRNGVFYPLQTFSNKIPVSFKKIPLCIEAHNTKDLHLLLEFAGKLSAAVYQIDSSQRKLLHMAAVFACNFTNFLYVVSQEILRHNQISFDLLRPLIAATAKNASHTDAFKMQTGPAMRGDLKIMEEHLRLLDQEPDYKAIYNIISDSIIKYKEKNVKL